MNNHRDFLLSDITDILKNAATATIGIGDGIETYSLCDYVMQSTFLKMTGFQEQKMKCICWEIATNDYQYRYDFTNNPPGECSSFKEKQKVYNDLVKQIKKFFPTFDVRSDLNKTEILRLTKLAIEETFEGSNLVIWTQNNYNTYKKLWQEIKTTYFANENTTLFTAVAAGPSLITIYEEHLYKHRNRCAHNTLSYQQNLPTLKTLVQESYKYENYFLYFAVLTLIDKTFTDLYKKYLVALEEN